MKIRLPQLRLAYAASLILLFGLAGTSSVQAGNTAYSGRAYAAFVSVPALGVNQTLSDTGSLPSSGGYLSNALLSAQVGSVLSADVLVASTSGASGRASSSASLADVALTVPGAPAVTASFLPAETQATCDGVTGSSQIADLTVGGQSIAVGTAPNQTISLPGGVTLILNEQSSSSSGTYRQISVNALHLTVKDPLTGNRLAEVILSHAESDINCVPPPPPGPCHDFVTGGGWIDVPNSRANFGFNAGFKGGSTTPDVHFNYIDHSSGMQVKATSITVYRVGATPTSRHFEGSCEINGAAGSTYYSIDVADNGEPGKGVDTLSITLSNGYSRGGTLAGGNIQLHAPCQ